MQSPVASTRVKDSALLVFLASGLLVGGCLAVLLGKPNLQSVWFEQNTFPMMPHCLYWVAHGVGLLLALMIGLAASNALRIPRPLSRGKKFRGFVGAAIIGASIPLVACPFTSLSMREWRENGHSSAYIVLGPILVALLVSLGLRIWTGRWYTALACAFPVAGVLGFAIGALVSSGRLLHADPMVALFCQIFWALVGGFWIRAAERDQGALEKPVKSNR